MQIWFQVGPKWLLIGCTTLKSKTLSTVLKTSLTLCQDVKHSSVVHVGKDCIKLVLQICQLDIPDANLYIPEAFQ